MLASMLKIGRGPLALACAASSGLHLSQPSLKCESLVGTRPSAPHFDRKPGFMKRYAYGKPSYCDAPPKIASQRLVASTRDTLKSTQLFREASDELLNAIAAGSDRMFFNPGEVSEEDLEKMSLYIVQDGLLETHVRDSSKVAFVGPGDIVGETAWIFGQPSSGETLKALKPTTAVVLDRSVMASILSEFPKERDIIMKRMGVTESA